MVVLTTDQTNSTEQDGEGDQAHPSRGVGRSAGWILVQVALESGEQGPDFFRRSEVGDGIGDGVVVL